MLSRVADSLYWMSRYLERAEHTARLVDVNLSLALEQSPEAAMRRWERVLASLRTKAPKTAPSDDAVAMAHWLAFDAANNNSVASCLHSARENARQVREELSSEMWQQINRVYLWAQEARDDESVEINPREFLTRAIESCHLIQGVTDATLSHGESWRFIAAGRCIERASNTASLLDVQFEALRRSVRQEHPARRAQTDNYLDWVALLNSCAAFDAYCKGYTAHLQTDHIAELLVLRPDFPHSICFSAVELEVCLRAIGLGSQTHRTSKPTTLAHRLRATLGTSDAQNLMQDGLHSHLRYVLDQCGQIHQAIHHSYFAYPVEEELAA